MKTLAERLKWVLENKREVVGTASDWSIAAGLSRTLVSLTIRRGSDMKAANLSRLADVAGVSFEWLASGKGDPHAAALADDGFVEEYPARALAVQVARKRGLVTESAISKARALRGMDYGKMDASAWGTLLLELTIGEIKSEPSAFHEANVMERLREHRQSPPPPTPKDRGSAPASERAGKRRKAAS